MTTKLIAWLLKHLLAVTAEQWSAVFLWVSDAAVSFAEGRLKNAWVREQIRENWPDMRPHVVDAIVGLAVGVLKRKERA